MALDRPVLSIFRPQFWSHRRLCRTAIYCRPTAPIYLWGSRIENELRAAGSDEILARLNPTTNVAHLYGVAGLTNGAWDEPVDERHENEEVFEPAAV
ncbi:hypothetical protein QM646_46180, partial [Rhodococcus erythropolis]|nr:hypothetical protein [Rhodococcus erythropolis]